MENALALLRRIADTVGPPAPSIPAGYRMTDEGGDADDMLDPVEAADPSLPAEFFITYADTNGRRSARSITLQGIKAIQADDVLLRCYCHMRQEVRTFSAGRIVEAVDSITGEVWEPPTRFLQHWGLSSDIERKLDGTLAALKAARHGVVVLTFLSRCDGHQHLSEVDIIVEYLARQEQGRGLGHDIDPNRLAAFMMRLKPDADTFFESARILASGQGESSLETVLNYAGRLIQADGVIHEKEALYANELMAFRK